MVATTYATAWPSGEHCGSRTSCIRAKSSSFSGWRAGCASKETAAIKTSGRRLPIMGIVYTGRWPVWYTTLPKEFRMPSTDQPSLYERLGGVYSIATVVDD